MKYYVKLSDSRRIYVGDSLILGSGNDTKPDAKIVFIDPIGKVMEIEILKAGIQGTTIGDIVTIPINLFGEGSEILEHIDENNPNSAFRALRNKF